VRLAHNLTPIDAVKFAAGYGSWLKKRASNPTVVIGRDARPSGPMLEQLVISTLQGLGIDVINAGLSTTPTVEMLVHGMQRRVALSSLLRTIRSNGMH
jgi:phosphomannomutase